MRKDFGGKTWAAPMPVLIVAAYDGEGRATCMNAAWGGIWNDGEIFVCLDKSHKTTECINARKAFTISFGTARELKACDYVGIVSGKKVPDKLSRAGWTAVKSEHVDAPVIQELPIAVECRLKERIGEEQFIGEIVNVSADETVIGADGKPDLLKAGLISYDTFATRYLALGGAAGKAFAAGRELEDK